METKLVKAEFNKEAGVSTVTISSSVGSFTGTARLHPEDKNWESEYRGCFLAELRATEKMLRRVKRDAQMKYKATHDIYYTTPYYYTDMRRRLEKKMAQYQQEINEARDHIAAMKKKIKEETSAADSVYKLLTRWASLDKEK